MTAAASSSTSAAASTAGETALRLMSLSATCQRISPEGRTCRMIEGRCYHCRQVGYVVRDCALCLRVTSAYVVPAPAPAAIVPITPTKSEN